MIPAIPAEFFTPAKSQVMYRVVQNFASIGTSNSGSTQNSNMLTTFNAGIMARSNSAEPIALEAGLLLEGNGAKFNVRLLCYFTTF